MSRVVLREAARRDRAEDECLRLAEGFGVVARDIPSPDGRGDPTILGRAAGVDRGPPSVASRRGIAPGP